MPFFSREFLATLRATNKAALDSRAVIARKRFAASPGGGANTGTATWTTIEGGAAVPCRLSVFTPGPATTQAGQPVGPAKPLVTMDVAGPAILDGDRLTVTGKDLDGTEWTRVVRVMSRLMPTTVAAMRIFACEDVGPGGL